MADKKRNTAFFWKIFIGTIVGILAATGTAMAFIFFLFEGFDVSLLSLSVFCALIAGFCLKLIIDTNRKWKEDTLSDIKEERKDVITEWTINEDLWKVFLQEQEDVYAKDLKSTAFWSFIAGCIVGGLISISEYSIIESVGLAFVAGIILSAFITTLAYITNHLMRKRLSKSKSGQVTFAKDVILYNDKVIIFNQLQTSLRWIDIDENREVPVLIFSIKTHAGRRSTITDHHIPFPKEKLTEAKKLKDFYETQLQ